VKSDISLDTVRDNCLVLLRLDNHILDRFRYITIIDLTLGCAKFVFFVRTLFLMANDMPGMKDGNENRNAIWKTNN